MSEKITAILDASAFKESSCILRTFFTVVEGYKAKVSNNDVEWGQAFHKFRSTLRSQGYNEGYVPAILSARHYYDNTDYIIKSNKKYLTTQYLEIACGGYATKYKEDALEPVITPCDIVLPDQSIIKRGTKLIEPLTRFAFPYYVDEVCEILIAGTIDELAQWKGTEQYVIVDLKTTSSWNIDEYFKGYNLSPQMITYRWAIQQYAKAYPDSFFAYVNEKEVSAMIDGVFYAGETKPVEFRRSKPIIFSQSDLDEFGKMVQSKVAQLVIHIHRFIEDKSHPLREGLLNGSCQTPYGPCKFFGVCSAPDEESRESILENQYKKELYNPLNHGN